MKFLIYSSILMLLLLAVCPAFAQTYIINEDFEKYDTGSLPGAPWVTRFSGVSALVSEDVAVSGIKSFKLASKPSWARVESVPLNVINDYMVYTGWVNVNQTDQGGGIGFGFTESSNTYRLRDGVVFGNEGNIHFGGYNLQSYEAHKWYKVMVYCDFVKNLGKVWIDDVLMAEDVALSTRDELQDFTIMGYNFSAEGPGILYFDDVSLYTPEFKIEFITDIPNDQGRQVRLNWMAHTFDTHPVDELLITEYTIWRMIDKELGIHKTNMDGDWDFITTVPAVQDSLYNVIVPTLADSNENGMYMSVFVVRAHTANIQEHWATNADSGYSIDNLSPEKVGGLLADVINNTDIQLDWDESTDADFSHYNIYRGEEPGFLPENLLASTTLPSYLDENVEQKTWYYKISAVDFNGNEGPFSDEVSVLVTRLQQLEAVVKVFDLKQNYPNPFNPLTIIRYQLPKAAQVKITIFNTRGQKLSMLVSEQQNPGYHQVTWDASGYASGIYYYTIQAGDYVKTRKMLLVH